MQELATAVYVEPKVERYQVVDLQTKNVVREFNRKMAARRCADRMDLEYGAIRYTVKMVTVVPVLESEDEMERGRR